MTQNDSCRERDDDDEPTCMTDGSSLVGVKVAEERGGPGGSRFFFAGDSQRVCPNSQPSTSALGKSCKGCMMLDGCGSRG